MKVSLPILLFLLMIGVVYSPVLYFNYLFHDDATFWVQLKEYGFKHIFSDMCVSQGRYGDALLLNLENFVVHQVSDLKFLRFLGIVIASCNAYFLLQQLRRLSFSDIQAFLVISAMFFLPGFAVIFFYSIGSAMFSFCIFLACWSFYKAESSKSMAIAVVSFLFAITIYPPAAMFYWVMVGMNILFVRDRDSVLFRENILRSVGVGLISLLIYAFFIFLMHYLFSPQIGSTLYNPYVLTHHGLRKLQWFFQEPMGNAMNLWNIFPQAATSLIVSGFIAITALIVLIRQGFVLTCPWQLALFIFVFFLTFLPNLAAQGNAAFYRCLIPLTCLLWLTLVWAILKWREVFPRILTQWGVVALLSIIVLYAGIKTFQNVLYYRVLPSSIEFNAYRSMAEEVRSKKIDAIHIFFPYHFSHERYDEFVVVSSDYLFDIYHLIYGAFKDTGGLPKPFPLVYVSYPGDDKVYELEEIYFKKMPDEKWVFKLVNRDGRFHEYSHLGKHTLDRGLTVLLSPQKVFSKRLSWYILNLNDIFSASIYNDKDIKIDPKYADVYYNHALAYYKQGDLIQAVSNYSKAVEINPKDAESYNDRAIIYFRLKQYDKSREDVQKMEKLGLTVNPQLMNALNRVKGQSQ